MIRLSTAIAAIALIGTPAFAADMGVPSAPPPAPVYNWTGWYVGVNAGASFGNVKTDFNVGDVTVSGPVPSGNRGTFPILGVSDTESPSGFMGGGQIGYNWQWSPLIVIGLEADIQGSLEKETVNLTNTTDLAAVPFISNLTNLPNGFTFPVHATSASNTTTQIDWFGTVRARIGYVWGNGTVLSYVTGGLAYGEVKINGNNTVSGTADGATFSLSEAFGQSHVNTGWVVGYGTEGAIDFWGAHNWTWRIEALYMDLGHLDTTGVATGSSVAGGGAVTVFGGQVTTNSHFTDGILRGGLNYRF